MIYLIMLVFLFCSKYNLNYVIMIILLQYIEYITIMTNFSTPLTDSANFVNSLSLNITLTNSYKKNKKYKQYLFILVYWTNGSIVFLILQKQTQYYCNNDYVLYILYIVTDSIYNLNYYIVSLSKNNLEAF